MAVFNRQKFGIIGTMDDIKRKVRQQFAQSAESYVTSSIHAQGFDLPKLVEFAELQGTERVLDVGTATGHTALTFAPHAAEVIGIDLTPDMLEIARQQAQLKKASNVIFMTADADQLPFEDRSFDRVTCRLCAHHFPGLSRPLAEMYRVLKPGGILLVVDNVAPEDDALDEWVNRVEKLRDPSHVREYRVSQWLDALEQAGFEAEAVLHFTTPLQIDTWTKQSRTPGDIIKQIKQHLDEADADQKRTFEIRTGQTYAFSVHKAVFRAKK